MPTLSFGGGSHLGVPCKVALLGRVKRKGGKTSSDQCPKGNMNIFKAIIRSARIRCRSRSSKGSCRMPVTNLVTNLWILFRWLISATRFCEQAGIPYSGCGRTKAPHKGMKADFKISWKERLIMKISRLALLVALVHWAKGEKILSVKTPRSLTNLDTGMAVPDPSGKKD